MYRICIMYTKTGQADKYAYLYIFQHIRLIQNSNDIEHVVTYIVIYSISGDNFCHRQEKTTKAQS